MLKEHITQAQLHYKHFANLKRTERQFEIEDLVYLKLQSYKQNSVKLWKQLKLSSKYSGPFEIYKKVDKSLIG